MIRCTQVWTGAFAPQYLVLLAVALLPGPAVAQVDYSKGKTPEQLFNSDCSACHASPQAVGRSRDVRALTAFLEQHYTTKTQWAALIANYLVRARDLPPPMPVVPSPEQQAKPSNAREVKSAPESLQRKLRSYATAGEEAKALGPLSND
jgi:mono/diheme cytochrome c family protein